MDGLLRVLSSASAWAEQERSLLLRTWAADVLEGFVGIEIREPTKDEPEDADAADDAVEGATPVVEDDAVPSSDEGEAPSHLWVRPLRFEQRQRQALCSCLAWHPGTYRQMVQTASGVCLRFATDADEIALEIVLDEEPSVTQALCRAMDRTVDERLEAGRVGRRLEVAWAGRRAGLRALGSPGVGEAMPHDGVGAVCDGRLLDSVVPTPVGRTLDWTEGTEGLRLACFSLRDPACDPGRGLRALPGLGSRHEVTLWLPCLRGCSVRDLWCDGTYVESLPVRPRLLVLGDEQAQGFGCDDPARAWPALLADRLGLELVNQGVAGQVFQPTAMPEDLGNATLRALRLMAERGEPAESSQPAGAEMRRPGEVTHVVVELGSVYRRERCSLAEVSRDVRATLSAVRRKFPDALVLALTPIWHDEETSPSHEWSSWRELARIIDQEARRAGVRAVDGLRLVDHDAALFHHDGRTPRVEAHGQIAARLAFVARLGQTGTQEGVSLPAQTPSGQTARTDKAPPLSLVPLTEAVRRGLGQTVVDVGGIALVRCADGTQMLHVGDHELGVCACAMCADPTELDVFGADVLPAQGEGDLVAGLARALGLDRVAPQCLCVYESAEPLPIDTVLLSCIRALDRNHEDVVVRRSTHV